MWFEYDMDMEMCCVCAKKWDKNIDMWICVEMWNCEMWNMWRNYEMWIDIWMMIDLGSLCEE